jgi:hypothetical protein
MLSYPQLLSSSAPQLLSYPEADEIIIILKRIIMIITCESDDLINKG